MSKHTRNHIDRSEGRKRDEPRGPDVSRFDSFKNGGYAMIFVVWTLAVSFNNWSANMWVISPNPSGMAFFAARLALFVVLIVLAFRWMIATHHEFDLWAEWLEHPFLKQEVYAAMIALSVVLGLLLAFCYDIVIISGSMTVYFFINYWTQWLCNDHFGRAIHRTRQGSISATKSKVLEAMSYFWVKRPQLGRITTMMFFSAIAFSLALAGALQTGRPQLLCRMSAYALLILDIVIGEIVIALWRHSLDQCIEKAVESHGQMLA